MKLILKKLCSAALCLSMLMTVVSVNAAEKTVSYAKEIDLLSQLGVLDVTAENASLTKQTVLHSMNAVMKTDTAYMSFFENLEPTDAVSYGQAVRVLVDALGYSPYVELLGYDKNKPESYIYTAGRIKLIVDAYKPADSQITVGEWAELLHRALTEIPLMTGSVYTDTDVVYDIDKDATMLTEYMDIHIYEGVVNGVDNASVIPGDEDNEKRIMLGNVWYSHSFRKDMYGYLGYYSEAYINAQTDELCAISVIEQENKVIKLTNEDIKPSNSKTRLTYYVGNRTKTANISSEADFICNRELVTDFSASDLTLDDCSYTLIDNDTDGKVDIILAEQYTSFAVGSRQVAQQRILDTDGTIFEMEEFFEDGGVLYDENGSEFAFEDMQSYDVVSCLMTRSGKMSYVAVVDKKLDAAFDGWRDDMKYIELDGVEYETTEQYRSGEKLDDVQLGDIVMAFLDINGKIIDMRYVTKGIKAAYLMAARTGTFDAVELKILDEDGTVRVAQTAGKIKFNNTTVSASQLLSQPELLQKGEFLPQLVKYKQNKDGMITAIDTANPVNKIGSRGNEEFTLAYDGSLTCLSLNGSRVLGSKYLVKPTSKVFIITTDSEGNYREEECLVQGGNALTTNQNPTVKLYNVNDNYEPEYIVLDTSWDYESWVDNYGDVYMVDGISQIMDENGDVIYRMRILNPDGTVVFWHAPKGDIVSPGDNETFGWSSSWSPETSDWTVQLKDLPRGSIIGASRSATGTYSIATHHIPKENNVMFERVSGTGDEYGLTETMFNGKYTMCFGEVIKRTAAGFIINCHTPTEEEAAAGGVFPMPEWNRHIPINATDKVVIYDRELDEAYKDTANSILPGDKIFMKRSETSYNGIYVYR